MDLIPRLHRISWLARKEARHLLRDPMLILFTLFIPLNELVLLGYAIDVNVRNIRTVILDQAQVQESRAFLQRFSNTGTFDVIQTVHSEHELTQALRTGKAQVGIKIPADFSRSMMKGTPAQLLMMVDGAESPTATEAMNIGNAITTLESMVRTRGTQPMPVDLRVRVLFNPGTRSPSFFLPGLLVILAQTLSVMLTVHAIVREKENGTLELLALTPIRNEELILGKLAPYIFVVFMEFLLTALIMHVVFDVPIHGDFGTLLVLTLPFVIAMQGVGIMLSCVSPTRGTALQLAIGIILPTAFLCGYIFPLESMPLAFQYLARAIPATWLIEASRGIILRGAGWSEFAGHAVVLWTMAVASIAFGAVLFQRPGSIRGG